MNERNKRNVLLAWHSAQQNPCCIVDMQCMLIKKNNKFDVKSLLMSLFYFYKTLFKKFDLRNELINFI